MVRLNLAKDILCDPVKRRQYDAQLFRRASTEDWLNSQAEQYTSRFTAFLFAELATTAAESLFVSLFEDIRKE